MEDTSRSSQDICERSMWRIIETRDLIKKAYQKPGIIDLSKLPSREELISEITGMVGSPGSVLSQLVSSPGNNIAGITVALEEQKAA